MNYAYSREIEGLPVLSKDVGLSARGYSGSAYGKSLGEAVVVELYAGVTVIVSYHIGIPVECAA